MARLIVLCATLFLAVGAAAAQTGNLALRDRAIAREAAKLEQAQAAFEREPGADAGRKAALEALISDARALLEPVNADISVSELALSRLGPPPGEGASESPAIAAERGRLNDALTRLGGQRARLSAIIDQANALIADYSARRVASAYAGLLRQGAPLIDAALWRRAGEEGADLVGEARAFGRDWIAARRTGAGLALNLALLAVAGFVAALSFGPAHRFMRARFAAPLEARMPTPARRVAVAGVAMLARLASGLVGGALLIETARLTGLIGQEGVPIARALWFALIAVLMVSAFSAGLLHPPSERWRIGDFDRKRGAYLARLAVAAFVIFGVKIVLVAGARLAGEAQSLIALVDALAAIGVSACLILACSRRAADETTASSAVRRLIRIGAVAILAAAAAGFVEMADFAATRICLAILLFGVVWFLRVGLREAAAWWERRLARGRGAAAIEESDDRVSRYWIGLAIDAALIVALAPALLMLAGLDAQGVREIVLRALIGVRIGGVEFSLAKILLAIAAFFGVIAATRAMQGALKSGPFAFSRIDRGVQDSFLTMLGYVGLIVAAFVGVALLGVDLSNVALIAGALSVGVGLGLQGVVNNFVSGLILLFERPIKVGDWIVTQSGEGIVKKISVRSTEIETFERSSIIVPNSELVASTVTNWTHRNTVGRLTVAVGVAYDSDPEEVRALLLECARAHPEILIEPEPFVVWTDFGASSLDFELRAFLGDVGKSLQVRTDLRFAIFKAFRKAGVEIPFPQQDIHIRSTETDAARPKSAAPSKSHIRAGRAPDFEPDDGADAP